MIRVFPDSGARKIGVTDVKPKSAVDD